MSKPFALGQLPTSDEARSKLTASRQTSTKATDDPIKPFNVRLPASLISTLTHARADDGVPAVARIRALIELWRDDAELQQRVADRVNAEK